MIRSTFRDDGPLPIKNIAKADPQVIGEALASISDDNGLTPSSVVEAARDPKSPLNPFFEWDDSKAAEAYREDQARALVRIIRVAENEDDEPVRAFISVSAPGGVSYRSADEVRNSTDLQLVVLRQAERDLEAWERRYRSLKDICDLVTVAREKAAARRADMEARAQ